MDSFWNYLWSYQEVRGKRENGRHNQIQNAISKYNNGLKVGTMGTQNTTFISVEAAVRYNFNHSDSMLLRVCSGHY